MALSQQYRLYIPFGECPKTARYNGTWKVTVLLMQFLAIKIWQKFFCCWVYDTILINLLERELEQLQHGQYWLSRHYTSLGKYMEWKKQKARLLCNLHISTWMQSHVQKQEIKPVKGNEEFDSSTINWMSQISSHMQQFLLSNQRNFKKQ